jgi:hypothetical protein
MLLLLSHDRGGAVVETPTRGCLLHPVGGVARVRRAHGGHGVRSWELAHPQHLKQKKKRKIIME